MQYQPMLCQMGSKDFLENKNYVYEVKLDGTRIILYKDKKNLSLINKNGFSKLVQYPEMASLHKIISPKNCVLDGEIIVYNGEGLPDFNLMLRREQSTSKIQIENVSREFPATYVVFDILEKNGQELIKLPLNERREILGKCISEGDNIDIAFQTKNGKALWNEIIKKNIEGVIAKKHDSIYKPGERSRDWLKIKHIKTADVVIVGYTSDIRKMSSIAMAVYDKGQLLYIGRCGTGYTEQMIHDIHSKLKPLETPKCPVANDPNISKIKWVRPEIVAEVEFMNVTQDGQLRAASFKHLRFDKSAKQCTWEGQL